MTRLKRVSVWFVVHTFTSTLTRQSANLDCVCNSAGQSVRGEAAPKHFWSNKSQLAVE